MNRPRRPLALRLLAAAAALAVTANASAITFDELDAAGNVVRSYAPTMSDWVFAPDASRTTLTAVSGGGYTLSVGTDAWGVSEDSSQARQISGAGVLLPSAAYGWRVNFSANLRTWDSYNDGVAVAPLPGGSLGFWDLFSVNLNTQGYYWDLVSNDAGSEGIEGPGGDLAVAAPMASAVVTAAAATRVDSLVPVQPAGSVVRYDNTTADPTYLPGNTWAWGGRDYAAGYFESVQTSASFMLAANAPVFVSLVLDTRTPDATDNSYPSWGQFGVAGAFNDVPGGTAGTAPGTAAGNPLLPVDGDSSDGVFTFAPYTVVEGGPGDATFLFIDPVVAVGFEYQVSGGLRVSEVLLPTLGDADGYDIQVFENGQWVTVGHVGDGEDYNFATAVADFRIMGIDAGLNLNPNNPVAFVTGLKFDGTGTAEITMTALTAAVPEPSTYALMLGGLGLVAWRRRQRSA